jgi:hypothetical protein
MPTGLAFGSRFFSWNALCESDYVGTRYIFQAYGKISGVAALNNFFMQSV